MDPSEACAKGMSASVGLQLKLCLDRCVIRYKQAKNIALLGVVLFTVGTTKSFSVVRYIYFIFYPFICIATSN
jgi:hypothetical protein